MMYLMIHNVTPGSSLIPPQMAHADACGDDVHGLVRCNDSTKQAFIRSCYCMTYNESTGPVVGACFYNILQPTPIHALYDYMIWCHPISQNSINICVGISTEKDNSVENAKRAIVHQFTLMR